MSLIDFFKVLIDIPTLLTLKRGLRPRPLEDIDGVGLQCARTASKFPNSPLLLFEDQEITWREFNERANQYTYALQKLGVKRGDVVSIVVENRPELLVLFIAVNKLGAIAAMINTNLRANPLRHCLSVTNSKLCVFGTELLEAINEVRDEPLLQSCQFTEIPLQSQSASPEWATNLKTIADSEAVTDPPCQMECTLADVALYVFTSGTTGLPKAAVMTNRRFLQSARLSSIAGLRCKESDRIYLCLPMYHSTGLVIGFGSSVMSGASILLRPKFSASKFLSDIRTHNVSHLIYVGELLRYLNNLPEQKDDAQIPLHTMMGNGLRPDIWKAFIRRFGISRVTEFYASSEGNIAFANIFNKECTIGLTASKVALVKYDVDLDEIVRDASGQCIEVPDGEVGLCLGHINPNAAFEGYTDSTATEKKIVNDVLENGDRWFNTGDLMRTVPVGFALGYKHYQFVDRTGDTYRWCSENVSTNEVAEVLNGFSDIALSNVFGVKIPQAEGRAGMAALTLQEDVEEFNVEAFSEHVINNLPFYARPIFIRILPQLEVTSTFKVIKNDLRDEGYDLAKVSDPLYILKKGSEQYTPLNQDYFELLQRGEARF